MGKNSKAKRDSKKKKMGQKKNVNISPLNNINEVDLEAFFSRMNFNQDSDDNFPQVVEKLTSIFSEYQPLDVFLSLSVSELWLPNISSPVKHIIALNVLLSMKIDSFNNNKEIKTYKEFYEFLKIIYQHLPSLPQLEDYVPEQDWNEIRYLWKDEIYRIFYGGSVERIPDYIKAFELYYSNDKNILEQMKNVLILQNYCLNHINNNAVISPKNISSGHIEIPSEEFWSTCCNMLFNISKEFTQIVPKLDKSFIKRFGDISCIDSSNKLSDTIMVGMAIPALGIEINDSIYPISFRNMVNVVIEHYALQNIVNNFSYPLSNFISQRFKNIISEHFQLQSRYEILPYEFSGLLNHNNRLYLFFQFDINNPDYLVDLTKDVSRLISSNEWAFTVPSSSQIMGIKNNLGNQPKISDIEFIFISSNVSTVGIPIFLPDIKYAHHILFLSEFISLFDSVDDMKELLSFWDYLNIYDKRMRAPFLSIIDKFASFKENHSVLEDGAISFDMIALDPHWGSNWRYRELKEYWSKAPKNFPFNDSKWNIRDTYQGNFSLIDKNNFGVSWSTEINNCMIHFYSNCEHLLREDHLNGQLITLFLECACDSLSQRKDILNSISLLNFEKITISCYADSKYLVNSNTDIKESNSQELFTHSSLINKNNIFAELKIDINLQLIQYKLNKPKDASFQAEICFVFMKLLSDFINVEFSSSLEKQIEATRTYPPRMSISSETRLFDTLEVKPSLPESKHFKLARKKLAHLIKKSGIQEGRYELQQAKDIINPLATCFREKIHSTIASINKNALLLFVLENYDACVNEYHNDRKRIILSLGHEVAYDRTEKLAKEESEFNRTSANYRYLLECTLSLDSKSDVIPTHDEILQLLANIDWLIVLYGASDILHNDIDVGGLTIDNFYIPQVFFSDDREIKEKEFNEEQASYTLGFNLNSNDEVEPDILDNRLEALDKVFQQDLGFNYSSLLGAFSILFQWAQINQIPLSLSYKATKAELVQVLIKNCKDLPSDEAKKIIDFMILAPNQIRKLLGSKSEYFDVPISDHNKRAHRYNIRPLIELSDDEIIWGAAATYRAGTIWISHIANGYLPAEFEWSHISHEVRNLKEYIEKQLEIKTFDIIKRFAPFLELGIDFKRRFAREKFPDVGDFDTLAYFPEKNIWLNIECKYNQPFYCVKDMRRLREKIFGRGEKRGQIGKIEKRIEFLTYNQDKIRSLLNWSEPLVDCDSKVINLYISRQIYWWLRHPPYEININFVQVDALESWLQKNIL